MKPTHLVLLFIIMLSGCALTPKTEIYCERNFSLDTIKTLGVIKNETYTMQPLSISKGISLVIAGQFGLAGVLVGSEMEYLKNRFDDSIDEEGIIFYQKSSSILKERLSTNGQIPFRDTVTPEIDAISLSKEIRDLRLMGPSAPQPKEIANFTTKHQLDYVLYIHTVGGVNKSSKQLFFDTRWRIYNAKGRQPIAIYTRSVDPKPLTEILTTSAMTDKLLELYRENTNKFLNSYTNLAASSTRQ